jgi:hypothetical protein
MSKTEVFATSIIYNSSCFQQNYNAVSVTYLKARYLLGNNNELFSQTKCQWQPIRD